MKKEIRFYLAEVLLKWSFMMLPNGEIKNKLSSFILDTYLIKKTKKD